MKKWNWIVGLALLVFTAACGDDAPVAATYVPSDCPPCAEADPLTEPIAVQQVDIEEEMIFAAVEPAEPEIEAVEVTPEPVTDEPDDAPSDDAQGAIALNSASAMSLTELPGVGPALAGRILEYREKRPFTKKADLMRVRGIGPAKYAKMQAMVTID